jgi:AcrR family transcriptional regulator
MADPAIRPYRQVARAEATYDLSQRIVASFLSALKTQWLDDITLNAIAAEARTTRQTVLRLFGSKDGLLAAAIDIWPDEVAKTYSRPQCKTPEELASAMVDMLEDLGPMFLRLLALAPRHSELKRFVALGRERHRQWFIESLSGFLNDLPPEAVEQAIAECLIATDTYTWSLLRHEFGRSRAQTQATMATMMRRALDAHPFSSQAAVK